MPSKVKDFSVIPLCCFQLKQFDHQDLFKILAKWKGMPDELVGQRGEHSARSPKIYRMDMSVVLELPLV